MGVVGSRMREFRVDHACEGMVCLILWKCKHSGCDKNAKLGVLGTSKPDYCTEHASEEMVGVRARAKRCFQGCHKRPSLVWPVLESPCTSPSTLRQG